MKDEYMNNLAELEQLLDGFKSNDISHDELGVAYGFHDAEKTKNQFSTYLENLIQSIFKHEAHLNELTITDSENLLRSNYDQIISITNTINSLATQGAQAQNYPAQRTKLTTQIENQYINVRKQLHALELELKVCDLNEKIGETNYAEKIKEDAEVQLNRASKAADNAEKAANDANKILNAAQDVTIDKGIESSASHFGALFSHHKDYEKYWLTAFIAASIALAASVIYALSIEIPENVTVATLISLIKRIILISVPTVFLRLALSKYNAERNLRIIYAHREKVLAQYKSFEAGIGQDSEAKNQFRIEIARYIFSDPQSNYATQQDSGTSEININPIMSAVERVSGGK